MAGDVINLPLRPRGIAIAWRMVMKAPSSSRVPGCRCASARATGKRGASSRVASITNGVARNTNPAPSGDTAYSWPTRSGPARFEEKTISGWFGHAP